MAYKLVCTLDHGAYKKGQEVTDEHLVAALIGEREHHFVKVWIPDPVAAPEPAPATPVAPKA